MQLHNICMEKKRKKILYSVCTFFCLSLSWYISPSHCRAWLHCLYNAQVLEGYYIPLKLSRLQAEQAEIPQVSPHRAHSRLLIPVATH